MLPSDDLRSPAVKRKSIKMDKEFSSDFVE